MDELRDKLLHNSGGGLTDEDKDFYVSISKAAELSKLSVSQIRYFEALCNEKSFTFGRREGPNNRNRVYTKRDVKLLQRVYQCNNSKLADIVQFIIEHQQAILESLDHITLPQLLKHEQQIAGYNILISGLVTILLSLWQEVITSTHTTLKGVIFGPQKDEWKTSFQATIEGRGYIDLADTLVTYVTNTEKEQSGDLTLFFSHQSLYLPFSEEVDFDTKLFCDEEAPFAITLLWERPFQKIPAHPAQSMLLLDEEKQTLSYMLMHSLKRVLEKATLLSDTPISIYARANVGAAAVSQGLSLLLRHCIQPYFPDCYSYVARLRKDNRVEVIEECGDINAGYTHRLLDQSGIINTRKTPWWIEFVKQQVSIALDHDVANRPDSREEQGSVVCLPLIRQGALLGAFGIENPYTDQDQHCLATRDDIGGPARLRYLICIAEIAAHYLDQLEASNERAERSRQAYTRYETIAWYWNIYQQGGINYTNTVESILDWMLEIQLPKTEDIYVAIVDIFRENELARQHKGFDIIVDLVQNTKKRIQQAIQGDQVALALQREKHLKLFDTPVADHLVLVATGTKMPYFLVFLERIRRFWRNPPDTYTWNEEELLDISLQVGVCTFSQLAALEKGESSELMKHHLWELYHRMIKSSDRVFEYTGAVDTNR